MAKGKIAVFWFIKSLMNEHFTVLMSVFLKSVMKYTELHIFYYSFSIHRIGCSIILSFKWPVVPVPNIKKSYFRWWYSYAYQVSSANWDRPIVSTAPSLGGLGRGGSEEELRGDF